jgi:hypothetical protein
LELDERENQDVLDFILKGVDKIHDGKKVEIMDLVPELKEIRDKSYSLFTHPGNPETAMNRPIANIGNVLATNMSEYIIFPLELLNTKNDFKYFNGLSNNCGLNFEDFLEHIRNGEIKPVLTCSPKEYDYSKNVRKCFYKDIFDACAVQDYTPPYSSWRVVRLFEELKLAKIADESGISIDSGWGDKAREKHPEYSITKCNEDAKKLLNNSAVKKIGKEYLIDDETVVKTFGTSLFDLRLFGFEGLADLGIELSKKDPCLGYDILNAYDSYFIRPCVDGLFGYTHYDYDEIRTMSFLRVITSASEKYWGRLLCSSPASSSIIVNHPIELNIIKKSSRERLIGFLKNREENEIHKCSLDMKNAFDDGDLNKVYKSYEKCGEVFEERINKELEGWFGKEKIANGSLRIGSRFIEGSPALSYLFETVRNNPNPEFIILTTFVGCIAMGEIADCIRNIDPKDVVKFWAKKWPLARPGLPFVLCEYDIKPKGRS